MLKRIRNAITEHTALTIVKTMGNIFMTSQTLENVGKLDVLLNMALRVVYKVYKPYEVHNLELYSRANLFSLKYRRNYFLLNMMFRLIQNENIEQVIPQRETRGNRAPTVKTYIALNDTIGKSPVYYARDLWNKLNVKTRNIHILNHLKTVVRKDMNDTYFAEEMARLTAGLFI